MTDNGEWVAFIESWGGGCQGFERISMIRADGTDYRIVLDQSEMEALKPNPATLSYDMSLSGNGTRLVFSFLHEVDSFWCTEIGPLHWYSVDTATGQAYEIQFNGQVVGGASLSDDGQTTAFRGYDPVDGWDFYLANAAGSGAVKFLETSQWFAAVGKLSGDGSKFAFYASTHGICPCPMQMFVYDFATGVTTTVTPVPLGQGIGAFDISDDGKRVVYSDGTTYGVLSDGSNHHVIAPYLSGAGVTLPGDGSHVLYVESNPGITSRRIPWEGGAQTILPLFGGSYSHVGCDATATVVAGWDLTIPFYPPLTMWFEPLPVLTTYGYGTPGTTLTWDVCSDAGDTYVLAYAFAPAAIPFKTYGILGLDPASLQVLSTGDIVGPDSAGQLAVTLPSDLVIPAPVTVYFQALVFPRAGPGARLTNTTAFTLGGGSAATAGGSGAAGAGVVGAPGRLTRDPMSPEEMTRRLRLLDPAVWFADQQAARR